MPKTAGTAHTRTLPHLQRDRLGTYYFRLTVAGKTLRRSLRTKDRALATMLASKLNWEWAMTQRGKEPSVSEIVEGFKKQGRKFDVQLPDGTKITGINTDDDARRVKDLLTAKWTAELEAIGPVDPSVAARLTRGRRTKGKLFSKAIKGYMDEKAYDNEPKTRADKQATFDAFVAACGDLDMLAIDKAVAVAFKQSLLAAKTAGAGRVNTKIGHMSDFFQWAVDNGEASDNPFAGTRISKKSKLVEAVESYEPFTADDLAAIFNPATYPAYAMKAKPHYHWMPFLLLHTGARPDELAGISLDDIRKEQGIDYFLIRKSKNSNSQRKVPFHKAILASGFMAYLAQRRQDDPGGQLFPMLKPSKNGYAKNVGRRFNETYLPSLRITDPLRRLYSFRATFITRMSELNTHPAMLMALVGHYEQSAVDLSSPHFKNYQGAKLLAALRDTINGFNIAPALVF